MHETEKSRPSLWKNQRATSGKFIQLNAALVRMRGHVVHRDAHSAKLNRAFTITPPMITSFAKLRQMNEKPVQKRTQVALVTIDDRAAGQRIDNFLITHLKGVPKTAIYRLLRTGQVRVDGRRIKQTERLTLGAVVRVPPVNLTEAGDVLAPSESLTAHLKSAIIFEDDSFVALNKPSGLASHGGSGVSLGLIEAFRQIHPAAERLELVHRLDRETSGVILLAKKRAPLVEIQRLIAANQTDKTYLALLAGVVKRERFDVNAALDTEQRSGGERTVRVSASGKPSLSFFRVLERFADSTLVQVKIETGRTHQIRVHAQHAGHPVLGDERYGDDAANGAARKRGLKRLFLHAQMFEFTLGIRYFLDAPLSPELKTYLAQLGGAQSA